MIVFPAIDLLGGKVVRLRKGERSQVDVYSEDPVGVALDFARRGAEWVHVVDLSSAFEEDAAERRKNAEALRAICETGAVRVDCGGGVRTLGRICELAEAGVSRIALGTALVRDPAFARAAAERFGDLLAADVAARDGMAAVNGWREDAPVAAEALVGTLAGMGFRHLVYTDVARDGMRTGVDAGAYRRVADAAGFPVVASGGVSSLADLRDLAALGDGVIEGVVAGRALYEGSFTLEEALAAARTEASPC